MDLESRIKHIHGPEEVSYELDELVVVCLMRDGRPYLKSFVEHYSSLGAKHVVFLDNGSSDGTVEVLKKYENVTILQTELPYREYKLALKEYLMTRFGKGRWVLYADIDELFDYPYSDVVDLSSFLKYLSEKSYTAVVAQMLDMFPEEPLLHAMARADEPLKELHRFYDISDITTEGYSKWPRRRRGWFPAGGSNTVASHEVEFHRGGIQRALFGHNNLLTKHPLVFIDDEIRPIDSSDHWVGGARVADITCVLFHYKFIGDFYERAVRAVEEENYAGNSRKYKRYLDTLEKNPNLRIRLETARELKGVNDLVDNQFLVVSGGYMARVDAEERKRGAGIDASQGLGPRKLIEAFSEASARARTQTRLAGTLRRQATLLEESLAKESRRLKLLEKKNRNLTCQIRDMRSSRSWRLLDKLGRIRARIIPGKG